LEMRYLRWISGVRPVHELVGDIHLIVPSTRRARTTARTTEPTRETVSRSSDPGEECPDEREQDCDRDGQENFLRRLESANQEHDGRESVLNRQRRGVSRHTLGHGRASRRNGLILEAVVHDDDHTFLVHS
jgi:hypothetical protein